MENNHPTVVYALVTYNLAHSYVGKTTNFENRLRQHNCIISKGAGTTTRIVKHYRKELAAAGMSPQCAEETSQRTWRPLYVVSSFADARHADHFEKCVKRTRTDKKRNRFGDSVIGRRTQALFKSVHKRRFLPKSVDTQTCRLIVSWNRHSAMVNAIDNAPCPWPSNVVHRMSVGARKLSNSAATTE